MPTLPLQHCAAPLCPELVGHGYCRIHSVQQEHARINYALRRLYRTSRWRHPISELRSVVLREEPICWHSDVFSGEVDGLSLTILPNLEA